MNTLVVSFYNFATISPGVMLDVLQNELDNRNPNDNVYLLSCFQAFDICAVNKSAHPSGCYLCEATLSNNLSRVEGDVALVKLKDLIQGEDLELAKSFFVGKEINRKLFYENFDVGEAAISSYISKTRDTELINASKSDFLTKVTYNALQVFQSVKRFLKEKNIDRVQIFNGRLDYVRAILRACEAVGIECRVYERARLGGYVEYFTNTLPHNILAKKKLIEDAWNDSPLPADEKYKIGSSYFLRKKNGEAVIGKSYISLQEKNLLPEGLDPSKQTFVLYNSSDDEFVAVGDEYKNPYFTDQTEGIHYLTDLFGKQYPEYNLIIRMHPNLIGVKYSYALDILKLNKKYPNIFVIPPDSPIDSYALLDIAWKVIVFGSSMGMEASFWQKPVILLAKCRYFYSDVAYVPQTLADLPKLIFDELTPKDPINAVVFGFYYVAGGSKTNYYGSKGLSNHSFKGRKLTAYSPKQKAVNFLIRAAYKIFNKKIRVTGI